MATDDKFRKRVAALHARLGSENINEREAAWPKLDKLLKNAGKTRNDLAGILSGVSGGDEQTTGAGPVNDDVPPASDSALDLLHDMLRLYLYLTPDEYIALALWVCIRTSSTSLRSRRDWLSGARCAVAARRRCWRSAPSSLRKPSCLIM